MKSILIIGLGRFGTHLIHRFYDLGDEVMAVDISEEKVQEAMPFVTSAKIGDCTKLDTLRTLGIKNFDLCFVCIIIFIQRTNILKDISHLVDCVVTTFWSRTMAGNTLNIDTDFHTSALTSVDTTNSGRTLSSLMMYCQQRPSQSSS